MERDLTRSMTTVASCSAPASANGDMTVSSACSPELLTLRCDGGDVWTVALGVAARIVYGRDTGRA